MTKKYLSAETPVRLAVRKAGGARRVAELLGVRRQAVYKWIKRGVVPPKRVLELSKAADMPPYALNPEVFL